MAAPGLRNLITDVPGILVGQAEDRDALSGTTVVLAERPAAASVDVRGGAPGSRETDLLDPGNLIERIDAVVLSGGSAYGLDAAGGVMDRLAAAGRGFTVGSTLRSPSIRVPIVPAAILFDLGFPGRRPWAGKPPYRALGGRAFDRAGRDFALGNEGAGLGATAGGLKGGIGSASLVLADGVAVGAIVAVNSWGSAVRPDCGRLWAADLAFPGEIATQPPLPAEPLDPEDLSGCGAAVPGANTTIAVVATDAALDKGGCRRLAIMAQDGLARAIRPVHTPFDGDAVFALSTGGGASVTAAALLRLGNAAAHCLARAVMRALLAAEPLCGVASWRQRWGGG
jgi:L-aminopeptidase/D-esterase-like protein